MIGPINMHQLDRITLHAVGDTYWADLHSDGKSEIAIFLYSREQVAAWQTLADTLAALDAKEDVT